MIIVIIGDWLNYLYRLYLFIRSFLTVLLVPKLNPRLTSIVNIVEESARKNPHRLQFICIESGEQTTIRELDVHANRISHWGNNCGLKEKNTVALMMTNSSDFVAIWLGLAKLGVSTALLNTNVLGASLLHSVTTVLKDSDTKILIVESSLKNQILNDIESITEQNVTILYWGSNNDNDSNLKGEVFLMPSEKLNKPITFKVSNTLLYIFTSGTTGLPKACKVTYKKFYQAGIIYRMMCELNETDRFYCTTPLYHSSAGTIGVSAALSSGACMVLRKKFSASSFTFDCLKYGVTSMLYIGELCRYLLNTPPNPNDKYLKIKSAFGNGMRPECWSRFQERYHVKRIVEFYAATEGNTMLINCFDKVGALGYIPFFIEWLYPAKLLRVDPENLAQPLRGSNGLCIPAANNEVGLLVSRISAFTPFDGYTDEKSNQAKILRDVLRKGDRYVNSGDLLLKDNDGFLYWSDRVGDTFRWKGENVATTEVQEVLAKVSGVKDANVYGVSVPGCDGKAGMGLLLVDPEEFSLKALAAACKKNLPVYARPLFLRIPPADAVIETTATMKYLKNDRVSEGFDPTKVGGDDLYVYDAKTESYSLLTKDKYRAIVSATMKL